MKMDMENLNKKPRTTNVTTCRILKNNNDTVDPTTTILHTASEVTEISNKKASNHKSLQSVVMNQSVKKIGYQAFFSCKELKRVKMTDVEIIEDCSFMCCDQLEQVDGSNKCKTFDEYCFEGCIELKKIDLSGAEYVGECAFQDCSKLVDVGDEIPVIDIGECAFRGCEELRKIKLNNVKDIGERAFEECVNLVVEGMENVVYIGKAAFAGVSYSNGIVTPPLLTYVNPFTYSSTDCIAIEITSNIRGIQHSAFSSNLKNERLRIDSSYIAIANTAFKYNDSLNRITITPNNICIVLYQSDEYFDNCFKEYELTINSKVGSLKNVITNHHDTLEDDYKFVISNYDWTHWGHNPLFSSKLQKVIGYNYDSAMESKSTIDTVFVNWTSCTRNYGIPPPLFTALKENLPWEGVVEYIFKANPDVVQDIDESTTLMPFMIAAVGEDSNIDSIFSLLMAYPLAINRRLKKSEIL